MNVKHWALFFVVTLSANYISATFLPFLGGLSGGRKGGLRGGGRRRSYDGWNTCNKRLHGYLSSNVDGLRRTFRSKYGGQCSLGDRELDNYSLRNVRAKGFGNFGFGDACHCNVEDGRAFIHFALTFKEIIASFALSIPAAATGILGQFFHVLIDIFGEFVNEILQIVFPSFLCDVVLTGDYDNGFRLSDFQIQEPSGELGFLGGLAGHGDKLGSFSQLIFAPLQVCISLFLNSHFRPIVENGVRNWNYDEDLFEKFGLNLGAGGRSGRRSRGRSGRLISGGGLKDGESDDGDSGLGGIREEGDGGIWGHGRRTGGIRGQGRKTGGLNDGGIKGQGRKTGGLNYGGIRGHGRKAGGLNDGGIRGHGRRNGGIRGHGRKTGGIRGNGRRTGGSGSSEESWDDESGYGESGDDESGYEESWRYESEEGGDESSYQYEEDEYQEDEEEDVD